MSLGDLLTVILGDHGKAQCDHHPSVPPQADRLPQGHPGHLGHRPGGARGSQYKASLQLSQLLEYNFIS